MRQLTIRHFRCFLAVADLSSFTEAATRLDITQSSLTSTIRQLEEVVGVVLFERTTRKVVLTADAMQFRRTAERVVRSFDNAINDLSAMSTVNRLHVRIAAAPSMIVHVLTPALGLFRMSAPDTSIDVIDGSSSQVEEAVREGQADFGLGSRVRNFPDLDYFPLLKDVFGVLFPDDHPLAAQSGPVGWQDLQGNRLVSLASDTMESLIDKWPVIPLQKGRITQDHALSTHVLSSLLSVGDRAAVIPALAARSGELSKFRFRELKEPSISREMCLITRPLRSPSASTAGLLKALQQTIQDLAPMQGITLANIA